MKKLKYAIYILLALTVIGTAVLLVFMPDRVPMHYNLAGEVDRFGSKYENLIWPLSSAVMAAFLLLFARGQRKKGELAAEKVLLWACLGTLLVFAALGAYFMLKTLRGDSAADPDLLKFAGIAVGALLMVLGAAMPGVNPNPFFGLRTVWSMANERVWAKSQRFGGLSAVACGAVMVILSSLLRGSWLLLLTTVVVIVWLLACVLASYLIFRADTGKN